jgi:hypothetical protein
MGWYPGGRQEWGPLRPVKGERLHAAGAKSLGCKEYARFGLLFLERRNEALRERQILRVVAQEPAPHTLPR